MRHVLAITTLFFASHCQGLCTVCSSGQSPPNTDTFNTTVLSDQFLGVVTCQELNKVPEFQALDAMDCAFEQTYTGIAQCGCEPPDCTLCPNGDTPFIGNAACEETQFQIYMRVIAGEAGAFGKPIPLDGDVCDGFRIEEPGLCGCETVETPCSYCFDRASATGYSEQNTRSCKGTEQTMPFVSSTSNLCTYLQEFNHRNCGCEAGPSDPTSGCEITCPSHMEINRTECKLADLEGAAIIPSDANICTQFVATLPGCCSQIENVFSADDTSAASTFSKILVLITIACWSTID